MSPGDRGGDAGVAGAGASGGAHVSPSHKRDDVDSDVVVFMDNVHKTYLLGVEGVPALRGVTLAVRRGEFVTIYGTSGGGKTTMLNVIGTIDKPTKGQLFLFGSRITSRTKDVELAEIRSRKMGFVFQTFNLLSSMTALENVEMPMILAGIMSPAERRHRAEELLRRVGMGHRLDHFPAQLSGGEQQRVTIARAVANKPELLLLDEPTGDLDTANTLIVMRLLLELNRVEGITMVMVTHDSNLKNFADRVVRMRDGKIDTLERIPYDVKAEAVRDLERQILTLAGDKKTKRTATYEVDFSHTHLRMPVDYSYARPHEQLEIADSEALHRAAHLGTMHSDIASVPPPPGVHAPGPPAPSSHATSAAPPLSQPDGTYVPAARFALPVMLPAGTTGAAASRAARLSSRSPLCVRATLASSQRGISDARAQLCARMFAPGCAAANDVVGEGFV